MLCCVLIFNLRCGKHCLLYWETVSHCFLESHLSSVNLCSLYYRYCGARTRQSVWVAVTVIVTMSGTFCSNRKKKTLLFSLLAMTFFISTKHNKTFKCHPKCVLYLWAAIRKYLVNVGVIILMHNAFLVVQTESNLNYEYYLWHELLNSVWETHLKVKHEGEFWECFHLEVCFMLTAIAVRPSKKFRSYVKVLESRVVH